MTEAYPISCVSCRRKKIKCNKLKPCNQCKKRQIVCQFPSTFRNIEINSDEMKPQDEGFETNDDNIGSTINRLKDENQYMLNKNVQLHELNKQLLGKLNQYTSESNYMNVDDQGSFNKNLEESDLNHVHGKAPESFKISGETSESGDKYYGPQSSKYMIESLKNSQFMDTNNYPQNYLDKDNEIKVGKSLIKKPLPVLMPGLSAQENLRLIYRLVEKFFQNYSSNYYKIFISKLHIMNFLDTYDSINNNLWENDDDLLVLIMILIFALERLTPVEIIDLFNIKNNDYNNFIYNLIHNNLFYNFEKLRHNLINESILTIQSYILCTEYYFVEQRYEECWSMMFHTCSIAFSIGLHVTGKLKLNEINLNQDQVSNNSTAHSNDKDDSNISDESMDEVDEFEDISKLKVWFSLRILSDKVCSILGRPNPISIQMNSKIIKYNQNYSSINLKQNKTSILLRIGLSECIRLSNMMLIENFMIDFTINDLLNLNSRFEKEINLLEMYLMEIDSNVSSNAASADENIESVDSGYTGSAGPTSGGSEGLSSENMDTNSAGSMALSTSASGGSSRSADVSKTAKMSTESITNSHHNEGSSNQSGSTNYETGQEDLDTSRELSYDESNYLPLRIEKINLLNDLIVFYVNKAKLFEPFIIKFNKNENDSILIMKNLSNSIINFLKLIYKFFNKFEIQLSKKNLNYVKIGKYFRTNFPFLNSFIYQGVIIIFTLLNYKLKDFVQLKYNDKFDNRGFLSELKLQLLNLLSVDYNFNEKIWSINITYLVNKNLEILDIISQQQRLMEVQPSDQQYGMREQQKANNILEHQMFDAANASAGNEGLNPPSNSQMNETPTGGVFNNMNAMNNVGGMTNNPSDIIGFNLNDPFWITNPDNLPYYLGSPNEELQRQAEEELKNINQSNREGDNSLRNLRTPNNNPEFQQPQPQSNKDFLSVNNQYEMWAQADKNQANAKAQSERKENHRQADQSQSKKVKLERNLDDFIPDPDYNR